MLKETTMSMMIAASSPGVVYVVIGSIVAALIAAIAAITSPIVLANKVEKQSKEREEAARLMAIDDQQRQRNERLADLERASEIASAVKEASDRAEQARIDLLKENSERAQEALRQQEAVALQAAEAARLLRESNERVAAHAAAASQMTQEKLDEIHTLVDGSFTAALRGELNALQAHKATLQELIADREGSGREVSGDTRSTLNHLVVEIDKLEHEMAERLRAIALAESQGRTDLR